MSGLIQMVWRVPSSTINLRTSSVHPGEQEDIPQIFRGACWWPLAAGGTTEIAGGSALSSVSLIAKHIPTRLACRTSWRICTRTGTLSSRTMPSPSLMSANSRACPHPLASSPSTTWTPSLGSTVSRSSWTRWSFAPRLASCAEPWVSSTPWTRTWGSRISARLASKSWTLSPPRSTSTWRRRASSPSPPMASMTTRSSST
mmetsp:Transcript_15585/g.37129  ORF Transcript_15585/g.37129 Transcript_15585/m.37129 type:complete len:201 (+) Transcript_15585:1603-2205(+)